MQINSNITLVARSGMSLKFATRMKSFFEFLCIELDTDEHKSTSSWLLWLPQASSLAVKDHVHALDHKHAIIALHAQDSLKAIEVFAFALQKRTSPIVEPVQVQRLVT